MLPNSYLMLACFLLSDPPGETWLVSCIRADTNIEPGVSTNGVWVSEDVGVTWTEQVDGLYPSRLVFALTRSSAVAGRYLAAMWGGGTAILEVAPKPSQGTKAPTGPPTTSAENMSIASSATTRSVAALTLGAAGSALAVTLATL